MHDASIRGRQNEDLLPETPIQVVTSINDNMIDAQPPEEQKHFPLVDYTLESNNLTLHQHAHSEDLPSNAKSTKDAKTSPSDSKIVDNILPNLSAPESKIFESSASVTPDTNHEQENITDECNHAINTTILVGNPNPPTTPNQGPHLNDAKSKISPTFSRQLDPPKSTMGSNNSYEEPYKSTRLKFSDNSVNNRDSSRKLHQIVVYAQSESPPSTVDPHVSDSETFQEVIYDGQHQNTQLLPQSYVRNRVFDQPASSAAHWDSRVKSENLLLVKIRYTMLRKSHSYTSLHEGCCLFHSQHPGVAKGKRNHNTERGRDSVLSCRR